MIDPGIEKDDPDIEKLEKLLQFVPTPLLSPLDATAVAIAQRIAHYIRTGHVGWTRSFTRRRSLGSTS